MKSFRPLLTRVAAVAAAGLVGLVGAVALASPASAHHSEITGTPECDLETGEWVVTWEVRGIAPPRVSHFGLVEVGLQPADSTVTNIEVTGDDEFPYSATAPLVGEQRLSGDETSASLTVRAKWNNGYLERKPVSRTINFGGPCEAPVTPEPALANSASTCDGLYVTVVNPVDGSETVTAELVASNGETRTVEVPAGESVTEDFLGGEEELTVEVWFGEELYETFAWEPEDCVIEFEIPVAYLSDCESLTIELTNPLEEGEFEATITVGETTETVVVEAGTTGEVVFSDLTDGDVATITVGEESLDITYERPEDCDEEAVPTPVADDGEGGELPVTGATTGMIAGGALGLLALGTGLFLLARRRRVSFTA